MTHQLQFLSSADKVVVVQNGKITEMGTYAELKSKGVEFSEFKLKKDSEGKTRSEFCVSALAPGIYLLLD